MTPAQLRRALPATLLGCLMLTACGNSSVPGGSPPRDSVASPGNGVVTSFCHTSSWVAGVTELCNGHLVYRDYIYDDYGADTGLPSSSPFPSGTLAATAGDARYPAGAENTADLVRFELWLEDDQIQVEFELNALYESDQTIAAIAVDTDNDPTTGGGLWPGLGIESAGWDAIYRFEQGDADTNLVRGRFPRPAGAAWKLWAVTAQADGTVMNVAFRGPDEKVELLGALGVLPTDAGAWWEDHQAAALAAGDVTGFSALVKAEDLAAGITQAAPVRPGLHQRVYTSAYTLPPGEGVSLAGVPSRINETNTGGSQQFNFLGKYQPYGYYLPAGPAPHGLQVILHGLGATHANFISSPGFQRDFGDALNRVIVSPLGRGVVGFYSDISERDVLDVLDDALADLEVDPDRVVMSGYSMGGYGALRIAMLYPDRFAALINWVGPTGDDTNTPLPGNPIAVDVLGQADAGSFVGNMVDFAGNLRNMPSMHQYAAEDTSLVHLGHPLTLQQRLLQAANVEYEFYLNSPAEHFTLALLDQWQREAAYTAAAKRTSDPARVTYRTDLSFAYPEYGIAHDRAYWISGIRPRAPGSADLEVRSLGCGLADSIHEAGSDVGNGPAPLIWTRQFRRATGVQPIAAQNRLEAQLANVSELTIDSARACLTPGTTYSIRTDGPVAIRLSDGRELRLEAGVHEGVVN